MGQIHRNTVHKLTKNCATLHFKGVKALHINTVGLAAYTRNHTPIGKIALTSVTLLLPILKGLSKHNHSAGAGTILAHQHMGTGNYALAGH